MSEVSSQRGWTDVVSSQVRLELSGEDLERRRLSDTVRSYETEHLTRPRGGQTMELERVGGVSVGDLGLEVGGKVDDSDGLKRAPGRRNECISKRSVTQ